MNKWKKIFTKWSVKLHRSDMSKSDALWWTFKKNVNTENYVCLLNMKWWSFRFLTGFDLLIFTKRPMTFSWRLYRRQSYHLIHEQIWWRLWGQGPPFWPPCLNKRFVDLQKKVLITVSTNRLIEFFFVVKRLLSSIDFLWKTSSSL